MEILRVRFRALRALPKTERAFDLDFSSLAATGPRFEDLRPVLLVDPGAGKRLRE